MSGAQMFSLSLDARATGSELIQKAARATGLRLRNLTLRLKTAHKPYTIWSFGPKHLKHESLEP